MATLESSKAPYFIYWCATFATVATWAFSVAAAADDAWLSYNGQSLWKLGDECEDSSLCKRHDAAIAFQYIATVLVSLALVVVVFEAFASPPRTGVLGLVLGIMLVYFSIFQLIALSLMASFAAKFNNLAIFYGYDEITPGPTLGVAVVATFLGLAGSITILVLRSRATKDDEGPFRKCMPAGAAAAGKNVGPAGQNVGAGQNPVVGQNIGTAQMVGTF